MNDADIARVASRTCKAMAVEIDGAAWRSRVVDDPTDFEYSLLQLAIVRQDGSIVASLAASTYYIDTPGDVIDNFIALTMHVHNRVYKR